MNRPSRRITRQVALQALYARSVSGEIDTPCFLDSLYQDRMRSLVDTEYLDRLMTSVIQHESELLSLIARIAPRFEVASLPVVHLLTLMMALTEQRHLADESIPLSVSISQAVEIAALFSDQSGKEFINGALATFARDKETLPVETITPAFLFCHD